MSATMNYHNETLYVKGIPPKIKSKFRLWCEHRGDTMSNQIIEFMRRTVRGEREPHEEVGDEPA